MPVGRQVSMVAIEDFTVYVARRPGEDLTLRTGYVLPKITKRNQEIAYSDDLYNEYEPEI